MRSIDLAPLHRFAVGFDNVNRLLDAALQRDERTPSYPPYNIEKQNENDYRITMAVAGFSLDDLDVTVTGDTLVVSGRLPGHSDTPAVTVLHRGIASRAFERRFQLADHIKVRNAQLADGLLHIDLQREMPAEKTPRRIEIGSAPKNSALAAPETKSAVA